jgi:predicted NBD/HSP70 family sugar kinase
VVRALQDLQDGATLTQAEIARATHLAPATVSNIVKGLTSAGMVEVVLGSGRRGTAVRIAREAGLLAGIDFGHRHVRVAVSDLTGQVLTSRREPIAQDHTYDAGLDRATGMLDALLADLRTDRSEIVNIGLGLPAPITNDNVVLSSAILPGWVGLNAKTESEKWLARPVHVENDANLGALAEHRHGAGVGHSTMVYVKVSSGVGAGMILGGELFRGARGTAGELGHLTIDEQGPFCRCGSRGCLEVYTSVGTAQAALEAQLPDASIEQIVAAARAGNVSAFRMFEDVGLHLGWGLAMLSNIVNPGAIIVGGDMSQAGDLLIDAIHTGMRRHALASVSAQTIVTLAALGDRASVMGALLLALDRTDLVPDHGLG